MTNEVSAPTPTKTDEKALADAMKSMVELMSRMYRNQVLLELNKGTIEKFSDAQTGNYASILVKLSNQIQKKLIKRFSNKRIEKLARKVLLRSDARSKKIFYERMGKSMGLDPSKLMKKDGMTYDINALVLETTQWAKKLRDETLEMYTANSLRMMTLGESMESILSEFDEMEEKRKNHAVFTARNQIQNFNSITNKTRAQKLGIKKAVWISSRDERTRPSHAWRDGREFDISKGLYSSMDGETLLPATIYRCRCSYKFLIDED